MSVESLLELFGIWGAPLLFVVLLFGAIGLPLPSSILLVASGAMMAQGDLGITTSLLAAACGAIAGDQIGYWIGRTGGRTLVDRFSTGKMARQVSAAEAFADRWGGLGVFLSRWLVSPLGPYINIVAAIARLPWPVFTAWGVAGEIVWVIAYAGLGYAVGHSIETLTDMLINGSWMIVAAGAVIVLGTRLRKAMRHR